jgi:hypothetical protein
MCRENGKSKSTKPIQKKQPQEEISQKKNPTNRDPNGPTPQFFLAFSRK